MTHSMLRAAFAIGIASLSAVGCAAPTGAESDGPEALNADAPEGDELGSTSQALSNCATGTAPNETLSLASVGVTQRYIRTAYYINPPACGGSPRRVTIVNFTPSVNPTHDYIFDVKAIGVAHVNDCAQHVLHTRLQLFNTSNGLWEDIGSEAVASGILLPGNGGFYCSNPAFHRTVTNNGGPIPPSYRVRTWAENPDGSFMGVDIKGKNDGQ
jgi:hypothetical protein